MLRVRELAEVPGELAWILSRDQQLQSPGEERAVGVVALEAFVAGSAVAVRFGRSGQFRGLGGKA